MRSLRRKCGLLALAVSIAGCATPSRNVACPCPCVEEAAEEDLRRIVVLGRAFDKKQGEQGYPEGAYHMLFYSQLEQALWAFVIDNSWVSVHRGGSLWVSFDLGQSWQPEDRGVAHSATSVFTMAEDKAHGFIYLTNPEGVFRKRAGRAEPWRKLNPETSTEKSGPWIMQIEVDEATGDLYGRMVQDGFGIHKLTFGEVSWKSIGDNLPKEWSTADIAFSAKERAIFIMHTESDVIFLERTVLPIPAVMKASVSSGTYRWQPVATPLAPAGRRSLIDISSDPATGAIYGGGYGALYRLGDSGHWDVISRVDSVTHTFVESGGRHRVVALTPHFSWLRAGEAWNRLKPAWDEDASVWSIAFGPGALVVGTNAGLFVSADDGATWNKRTPPKPSPAVK